MRWFATVVVAVTACHRGGAAKPAGPHPVDVAVTDSNTAVVMSDGTVRVWGLARRGAIGWLDQRDVAVPVAVPDVTAATEIVSGGRDRASTFCARSGAQWWCWGSTTVLPRGDVRDRNRPDRLATPTRIEAFTGIKRLRLGWKIPVSGCAIDGDDHLSCWLASSRTTSIDEPGAVADVALGSYVVCALGMDGRVWCWGADQFAGVDGVTGKEIVYRPEVVSGVTGATAIAVGDNLACARVADDQLACWGLTFYGAGVVRIAALPGSTLFAGGDDVCELAPDGRIRCLGHDAKYMCPHGTDRRGRPCTEGITGYTADAPPWRSIDATPATRVGFGREHVCAITREGALECAGRNDHGELGDGTLVDRPGAQAVAALAVPATAPGEPPTPGRRHAPTRWDRAPPGCVHDAVLDGEPDGLVVLSAWAGADASWIALRGYPSAPSDSALRGNERELAIQIKNVGPTATGQVPLDIPDTADIHVKPFANAELRSSDGDDAAFADAGTVTITVHDAHWVCGTIDAPRDTTHMRSLHGAFAAEIAP